MDAGRGGKEPGEDGRKLRGIGGESREGDQVEDGIRSSGKE